MRLSDLFQLLARLNACTSGGEGLLELSDMSLQEECRGPARNPMYTPTKPRQAHTEEELTQRYREARQRFFRGGESRFPQRLAEFWMSHFDESNFVSTLEERWETYGQDSTAAEVFQANGYKANRKSVVVLIASLLQDGLRAAAAYGGSDKIDDKPWDPGLLNARKDEIAHFRHHSVAFRDLSADDIKVVGDVLHLGTVQIALPSLPPIPQAIGTSERNYIRQALLAIASVTNLEAESIRSPHAPPSAIKEMQELLTGEHPAFKEDLAAARTAYFEAQHLRELLRHAVKDGREEFERINEDTYTTVRPTTRRHHANGFEKMNATLEKVADAPLQASHLTGVSGLFKTAHRHGIVHMLVNDNRIQWVSND